MSTRDLPPWIVEALARQLEQAPREPLRRAQQHLSEVYRSGGHSNVAIRTAEDALAYAVVRMPATYAACAAVFDQFAGAVPDVTPRSVLDIGAGPGTASFAAANRWSSIRSVTLCEPHPQMAALSKCLCDADPRLTCRPSVARRLGEVTGPFDLVVASYVLTEQDEADTSALVAAALRLSTGYLVLIEPGTTRGYQRLMAARATALAAGLSIVAPCPGDGPCPLADEDWCHFKVRLNRLREHRLIKRADTPFEDEPYSYLVIAKQPLAERAPIARLLREPKIAKAEIALTLCTASGLAKRTIPRRNKAAYKAAKHWSAGDAFEVPAPSDPSEEP